MRIFLLTIGLIFTLTSCQSDESETSNVLQADTHKVVVLEVLQTTNYTYLYVKENDTEMWLAVSKMAANKGETYYYEGGMLMENFESKELNRTFEKIRFLDGIRKTVEIPEKNLTEPIPHDMKPTIDKKEISVSGIEGGITIKELFSDRTKYEGETVIIKGVVSKVNLHIMNRNWIHLQDGTDHEGEYDLTVTSAETVKAGDTIVVEGKISLKKDFGYGYSYEVIMEDAVIK